MPLSPEDRLSIATNAADLARCTSERRRELKWPMEQVRRGQSIPPATLIDLFEGYDALLLRVGGNALLVATLICKEGQPAPPPWWSRLWQRLTKASQSRG